MSLDPINATKVITESYVNYLSTTFRLSNIELQRQFEDSLRAPDKIVKGPIIEATPQFVTGYSTSELVKLGTLSNRFLSLKSKNLPIDRLLYLHQQQAIEKSIKQNRNIVVATGTGSGKTETFVIPVLQHLFEQAQNGNLTPGVRALFLYPMNALANDQMIRLRGLLENVSYITFGRYTGETLGTQDKALALYRRMFEREPLENELISRERMRASPPHILLTNYAMLEYLLLRPDDNVFFDGKYSHEWRFLVIDEAHTYSGAKGIEMAMLLRRLKDRIVDGKTGRLRCFATSATLGSDQSNFSEVVKFANQIFDEPFRWEESDESQKDVVVATRQKLRKPSPTRWKPDPRIYKELLKLVNDQLSKEEVDNYLKSASEAGIPKNVINTAIRNYRTGLPVGLFLYHLLVGDSNLEDLRKALEGGPRYLDEISKELFGDRRESKEWLTALVDLAVKAKESEEDQSLIPARYHLFIRAIEGAFVSLSSSKKLFLERHEHFLENSKSRLVFEIAACRQCGATYLVGELKETEGNFHLVQPGKQFYEDPGNLNYYLLLDEDYSEQLLDEDEQISLGEDVELPQEYYKLCTSCGIIDHSSLFQSLCQCGDEYQISVLHVSSKGGKVHLCPACGTTSRTGLVWRFLTGNDATASVLATSLYQEIPPNQRKIEDKSDNMQGADEIWSRGDKRNSSRSFDKRADNKAGRQLLTFSDSRQDAAFFAPYLERTYSQILRRRIMLKVLQDQHEKVINNQWRVVDMINPLRRAGENFGLFDGLSQQQKEAEAWKWILYELLAMDRRNSLEGLGLLGFSMVFPENWQPFTGFQQLGLSEEETRTLYQVLLIHFRTKGAILFPNEVSPEDEFFAPRNRTYYFVKKRPEKSRMASSILGWLPTSKNSMNSRLDYLLRVIRTVFNIEYAREDGVYVLSKIWNNDLFLETQSSDWSDYFSITHQNDGVVVYQIKPEYWELQPGIIDPNISWHICDTCNNLTLFNIKGVCPTYRCPGRLNVCDPRQAFKDNHYRKLYTEVKPIRMVAKEHTAQLTSQCASRLQTQFIKNEVDVLSCSTTFELGVDVGELEAVFMRNVPPSAANYLQRAGRAGRRTSSTAFSLTFAQRRSHDLSHFNDPIRLITGEIKAPYFEVANEKIIRRHVYATALASFWRSHPDTFKDVQAFFFKGEQKGPEKLDEYLAEKPKRLETSIKRIIPRKLQEKIIGDGWGWTAGLLGPDDGVLNIAKNRVTDDLEKLGAIREELIRSHKPSDYILKVMNTIKDEYLISYLSKQNVLPKYGFPVDVVELQILHHSEEAKNLELSRDLRVALSEYAPSSQVVAGGMLWTSRYIKRLPDHAWKSYSYAVCDWCQCYQSVLVETDESLENCSACGSPLEGRNKGQFIIPQFGFITETGAPGKPGEARPVRTYSTRTYFRGISEEKEPHIVELQGLTMKIIPALDGELAVINHAGYQGFKVCYRCGYASLVSEKNKGSHPTPWHSECNYPLKRIFLGHEFKTDVTLIRFDGHANADRGFWFSLLYSLLEGTSQALEIESQDLDGVLYPYSGDPSSPALVLFDDVPGGAGHVKRICEEGNPVKILEASLKRLELCNCGGTEKNASCYGCLRNYRNQFCHDELKRGPVIDFFTNLL